MKKIKLLIAAVILIVPMVLLCSCSGKTISLDKYVTAEFTGAEGYGRVDAYFDSELLVSDLMKDYKKAMERLGTKQATTLFVGDQLFTDVWGANRAGIKSYLVKPIHPKEEIQIVLKRYLEKIVLFFYKNQIKKQGGQADDK